MVLCLERGGLLLDLCARLLSAPLLWAACGEGHGRLARRHRAALLSERLLVLQAQVGLELVLVEAVVHRARSPECYCGAPHACPTRLGG